MEIAVLMSRWRLLGLLSGTLSAETILSVCYDCFLPQTPLFSIIDFLCLLSQPDAFDLVSPELSKGRLRLSGTVTDSVALDACGCLFVLSWNDWDHCGWGPESPSCAAISPYIKSSTLAQPFLVSQGSHRLSGGNSLQHLFRERRSMHFLNEAKRSLRGNCLMCAYKQKWEKDLKEKKGH